MTMTNHMWSGFNLMANLALWRNLPADIQSVIERNATKYVRLQREDQGAFNGGLRKTLTDRGMVFNDVDQELFRARMAPVYAVERETWCQVLVPARRARRQARMKHDRRKSAEAEKTTINRRKGRLRG
jgi:TRAP-type C4-dicarboxylate transport system substrate-binding protein